MFGWKRLPVTVTKFMLNQRKAVLQLLLFLAVFHVLWTLRATWLYTVDESIGSPTLRSAYSQLIKFLLWVVPAAAFGYWMRGVSPAKYLGLTVFPDRRSWWLCLSGTFGFLLVVTLVETGMGRKHLSMAGLTSLTIFAGLLQVVVSPLLEELLFRGLVMKELLTLVPPYLANALTSLLFLGAHLPYWLSHGGLTQAMMRNAIGVFLFSVLACWLFSKTASVWPPTFAHIANNLLSSLLTTNGV